MWHNRADVARSAGPGCKNRPPKTAMTMAPARGGPERAAETTVRCVCSGVPSLGMRQVDASQKQSQICLNPEMWLGAGPKSAEIGPSPVDFGPKPPELNKAASTHRRANMAQAHDFRAKGRRGRVDILPPEAQGARFARPRPARKAATILRGGPYAGPFTVGWAMYSVTRRALPTRLCSGGVPGGGTLCRPSSPWTRSMRPARGRIGTAPRNTSL